MLRSRRVSLGFVLAWLFTAAACGSKSSNTDAHPTDGSTSGDVPTDTAHADSAVSPTDSAGADHAGGTDAQATDTQVGGDGAVSPATVPMFVAVGGRFRRMISCDDGRTWVANQVDTSTATDEAAGARGLGYGNGLFVAATGGGSATGRIFSTPDGVVWTERVPTGTYNGFSQVAYGNGYYVAGGGNISIRSALGTSGWGDRVSMGEGGILRHVTFGGGKFVAVGGGRIEQSPDGLVWAPQVSGSCASEPLDVVFGNNRFLAVDQSGAACVSTDGGLNWTSNTLAGGNIRGLVWTGHDFLVRALGTIYRSTNGTTWTAIVANGGGPDLMAVAASGTLAGVAVGTFYRSTDDGMTWSNITVPASTQSINRLVFGYGSPSTTCSGP